MTLSDYASKDFPFVSLLPLLMKRRNEGDVVSIICIGKSILLVIDTATSFHLNLHYHYPEADYRLTTIGKVNSNLSLIAIAKFTY
ncbi:hypothetical protein PQG02_19940 [Nostoc sp. UHCC 0926]|uniref:hypothetical protein n=1 Tax=unclassified Nostoc TaxID=2593658 RepID=UPI00235F36ED|nr:hypothetical protein [Nostoc sp. UHCC 0926]WDD30999.1 hypothetical protein PQG02_19940 [Nostoc sp. UHCC 0926]